MRDQRDRSEPVVSYQSSRDRAEITPAQETVLCAARRWPRDVAGEEIVSVRHGLHAGTPTWTDGQIARYAAGDDSALR